MAVTSAGFLRRSLNITGTVGTLGKPMSSVLWKDNVSVFGHQIRVVAPMTSIANYFIEDLQLLKKKNKTAHS